MYEIISLPYGYFDACCYLIKLPTATCLIDPAVSPDTLPDGLPPVHWIVATHGHFDHISQADNLRRKTNAPLFIHQAEASYLTQAQLNLSVTMQRSTKLKPAEHLFEDQEVLKLTDGYQLQVLHTPGHTPEGFAGSL
jgi:glyoxylase-like metal-dependent hydrolase (beta-lactamase superfamily II)